MRAFPPSPLPRRGATEVKPLRGFRVIDLSPPWGGPTEATS